MKRLAYSVIVVGIMIYVAGYLLGVITIPTTKLQIAAPKIQCDSSLWAHVYAGDPRKFKQPQDRLKIIKDCVSVSGVIDSAVAEADGDWHLRLKLDPQYAAMLNAKNISGQGGHLVLEPVCENRPITQKDTLLEKSCDSYMGHIFNKSMIGKRVVVVGAYVQDLEHGWAEVHPISSITVQ